MIGHTPSILITDDDRSFRETLRDVLEPRGFRTLLAEDGEEALHIVRHQAIHVALLDMHMPRLTGLETIRRVREFKLTLPCILISAEANESLAREAEQVHVYSVLPKPVNRLTITQIVDQALAANYGWRRPKPGQR